MLSLDDALQGARGAKFASKSSRHHGRQFHERYQRQRSGRLRRYSPEVNELLQQGVLLNRQSRAAADSKFREALALDPSALATYFCLYKLHAYQGALDEALAVAEAGLAESGDRRESQPTGSGGRDESPKPAPGPARFALYTLKAIAFIHLRRGEAEENAGAPGQACRTRRDRWRRRRRRGRSRPSRRLMGLLGEAESFDAFALLEGARQARTDPVAAERAVASAIAAAPDDFGARLGAYRFYFYNHRFGRSAPDAASLMRLVARRCNVAGDWRAVQPGDAVFEALEGRPGSTCRRSSPGAIARRGSAGAPKGRRRSPRPPRSIPATARRRRLPAVVVKPKRPRRKQ